MVKEFSINVKPQDEHNEFLIFIWAAFCRFDRRTCKNQAIRPSAFAPSASLGHFVPSLQWTAPQGLLSLPQARPCARAHSKSDSLQSKLQKWHEMP